MYKYSWPIFMIVCSWNDGHYAVNGIAWVTINVICLCGNPPAIKFHVRFRYMSAVLFFVTCLKQADVYLDASGVILKWCSSHFTSLNLRGNHHLQLKTSLNLSFVCDTVKAASPRETNCKIIDQDINSTSCWKLILKPTWADRFLLTPEKLNSCRTKLKCEKKWN